MKYNEMELKPIKKVQAFEEPREMYVYNDENYINTTVITRLVSAIYRTGNGDTRVVTTKGEIFVYCAEIPKPKTRKINSLEVMEYLHLLQLWLSGIKTCNEITLECNWFVFPVLEGGLVQHALGLIVYDPDIESDNTKYSNYSEFNEYDKSKDCKFGILKNGKVTEFELPEVTDEN